MTRSVTFCATGRTGLGHLRRVTNVARALREMSPDNDFALLTNAPLEGLTSEEVALFPEAIRLERRLMADHLQRDPGGAVVVDTALLPGLHAVERPLCLILRETVAHKVGRFALDRGRPWDLIILPNPEGHWSPEVAALSARNVVPVGWIYRRAERGSFAEQSVGGAKACVLIASGGGGGGREAEDFGRELEALLRALRAAARTPFETVQCLGPRAPAEARVAGVDRVVRPGGRLHDWFAQADLIVSTAGYNSVLEIASSDVPTLLIPIPRTYDDQGTRAESWAARLGRAHRWGAWDLSARWMASVVDGRTRRPVVDLGPSGAARAARHILDLLP